ncbi:MAG: glycosyltransferase family 4 protein [Thermoproteus sp.]
MKIAFLIGELDPQVGQTNGIIEPIFYLLNNHSDWKITIFSPRIINRKEIDKIFENKVEIMKLNKYYMSMIAPNSITKLLNIYDIFFVKGNYEYVIPAIRTSKPVILSIAQIDSPKLFNSIKKKVLALGNIILTKYIIKKVTLISVPLEEVGDFYKRKYNISPIVIEDIISDQFFVNEANRINSPSLINEIKLLSVGYWDGINGRKRQHELLKYFKYAQASIPSLRLTLVGLRKEDIIFLKNFANQLNIDKFVELKGYLTREKLVEEYIKNHIYVTATTYEGFYRQIIEAFATGMPGLVYDSRIITKDLSKSASVIHVLKSNGGLIFKDYKTFTDGVLNILNNYNMFSKNAINYANNFRSKKIGPKIEKLIFDLVK